VGRGPGLQASISLRKDTMKYTIVKDTFADEYALLYADTLEDSFKSTHKVWAEGQKDMGPDHLFWNGGKEIKPLDLSGMDEKTKNMPIPVIHFYKDQKVYETAFYTSRAAEKRYKIIKGVETEDQFFKYIAANPL